MITKEIIIDKTEILKDGTIQIREKTRFYEDGVMLSESNTDRRVLSPGDDASTESTDIREIVSLVHTPEKVKAHKTKMEKNKIETFSEKEDKK